MDDKILFKQKWLQNCGTDHVFMQSRPVAPSFTTTTANDSESVVVSQHMNGKSIEMKKQSNISKKIPKEPERADRQLL